MFHDVLRLTGGDIWQLETAYEFPAQPYPVFASLTVEISSLTVGIHYLKQASA